jgi:type I restriction-modification system DNA methylase subunit
MTHPSQAANTATPHPQELQDQLNDRAEAFSKEFANASYEMGQGQNFVRELCGVYGLNYLRSVDFERRVAKDSGIGNLRIDGFFPGQLLVEMKSRGKDLAEAYVQARGYIAKLKNKEDIPLYILVSDFQNLHLYDLKGEKPPLQFKLADFKSHVNALDFLLGYERIYQDRQAAASIEAASRLGNLHDAIKQTGYRGQDLQTLLVRLLFCLFADDTALFNKEDAFKQAVQSSNSAGDDLGGKLQRIFRRLDTNPNTAAKDGASTQRTDGQYAYLLDFPYVNGALFTQRIQDPDFDAASRQALLGCCDIDWSEISPDIFGTLFQHIMHWDDEEAKDKSKKRRDFGAHYTSERNIRRAIDPLFLEALQAELALYKGDAKKLKNFVTKLASLHFFDPACGCGNFLVVTYRELRWLEQQTLLELNNTPGAQQTMPLCNVHQFHGIEIDPTAAEIATVAMWLTDHQMNQRWANGYKRIPLVSKANIHQGNALRVDWNAVIAAAKVSFIVGNPPFLGYTQQSAEQKADMALIFGKAQGTGVLDYVTAWYVKAFALIKLNPLIKAAFVSTNSITQGEQVSVLWQPLFDQGLHIQFAHRTFKWSNEGSGVAAVHCVIVGFGLDKPKKCDLWDYGQGIGGAGQLQKTRRINAYLVDAPAIFLSNRREPLCKVSPMNKGSQPTDGGHLLLSAEDEQAIRNTDPIAARYIRPFLGADEFLNNTPRFCLWLADMKDADLAASPELQRRIAGVKAMRLASPKVPTQKLAAVPHLFGEIRQPEGNYLLVPSVSSERRSFVPIGYIDSQVIVSNLAFAVPNATLYQFGMLNSTMHNAWMRAVCGRLESRYRYSNTIVYNNYPWPTPSPAQQAAIEAAAQSVLDARAQHPEKSLAWLYDPENLRKNKSLQAAHDAVDEAVDLAYGYEDSNDDTHRVAYLFKLYEKLALAPMLEPAEPAIPAKKPRQTTASKLRQPSKGQTPD